MEIKKIVTSFKILWRNAHTGELIYLSTVVCKLVCNCNESTTYARTSGRRFSYLNLKSENKYMWHYNYETVPIYQWQISLKTHGHLYDLEQKLSLC